MTYGIKITNVDNRVVLDSSENRPILIKTRNGTTSVGTNSFASLTSSPALSFNDMIFARRTASGKIAEDGSLSGTSRGIYASSGGSLEWLEAKAINASGITGFNSGYGLNIFDGAGTATSNLLFTTAAANSMEIVSIGTFEMPGSSYYKDVPIVAGTVPHFILITGTWRFHLVLTYEPGITSATNLEVFRGYEYIYTGTTLTKIRLWNSVTNNLANPISNFGFDSQVGYVIAKLRS